MIEASISGSALAVDWAKAGGVMGRSLVTGLRKVGAHLKGRLQVNVSGGILQQRSGRMRRSVFYKLTQENEIDAYVTVGGKHSVAWYWETHELGKTIVPKKAAHLAIPIEGALSGKGVARFTARAVLSDPGSFGFTGTFTAKSVIFGKRGHDEIEPLFVLKDSVTVPARRPLSTTLQQERGTVTAMMDEALKNGLARVTEAT